MRSLHQSKSRTLKKKIVARITFLSLGVSLEVAFALVSRKRKIQTYTLLPILHALLTILLQSLKMTLPSTSYLVNVRILTRPLRVLTPCNLKWSTYVPFRAILFRAFKFTNFDIHSYSLLNLPVCCDSPSLRFFFCFRKLLYFRRFLCCVMDFCFVLCVLRVSFLISICRNS